MLNYFYVQNPMFSAECDQASYRKYLERYSVINLQFFHQIFMSIRTVIMYTVPQNCPSSFHNSPQITIHFSQMVYFFLRQKKDLLIFCSGYIELNLV